MQTMLKNLVQNPSFIMRDLEIRFDGLDSIQVADALRGQVYDVVCKFDPGSVRNTTRSLCSLQDFPLSYCSVA